MIQATFIRRFAVPFAAALFLGCGGGSSSQAPPQDPPGSTADARRFLTQATFGPTDAEASRLMAAGYAGWLEGQFNQPASGTFLEYLDLRSAQIDAYNAGVATGKKALGPNQIYERFYGLAATAPDVLRQRVAFALSQIMVVSMQDSRLAGHLRSVASYYDALEAGAFGNFRKLLEDVTLHPAMGIYLSAFDNLKEDPTRGRLPDENFAREVMQLFTIGLNELNPDGTLKLDTAGKPIPTYTHDDVAGLAKVFTGFGWYAPFPSDDTFWSGVGSDSQVRPMMFYPQFHSTSPKQFLGRTLPGTADPALELKAALDALFNHPNVGPFLARRLIQRLVTSNPTPAYVGQVAEVFNDNGKGVRGDLKAVLKAILLNPEARSPGSGKLREPLLRFTQWARAFGAVSQSGFWLVGNTDDPAQALGQSPLNAPNVFNFWRPGYVPAQAEFAGTGLVAPEFQGVNEVSVAGYLNFMLAVVDQGWGGGDATSPATAGPDVQCAYAAESALAAVPADLADHLDQMLLGGAMSPTLRADLVAAMEGIPLTTGAGATLNRAKLAVLLVLASPEFLHQR
jgi:uncharacterized protein (DUF1800 family)